MPSPSNSPDDSGVFEGGDRPPPYINKFVYVGICYAYIY